MTRSVGLVHRHGQHFAQFRVPDAVKVDLWVFVDKFFFVGLRRIDTHESKSVPTAIAEGEESVVVKIKELRQDCRAEIGLDQRSKISVVAAPIQQGCIQAIAGYGQTNAPGVIRLPANDIAGVLGHQHRLTSLNIGTVNIKYFGVPAIVTDKHVFGIVFQVVLDAGANSIEGRKVYDRAAVDVNRQHVKVFISVEILFIDDGMRAFPEISADIPLYL